MIARKNHTVYINSLHHLVDELFEAAYQGKMTWVTLAQESGLSYSTVRKLGERKTKYPQYRTVMLIAKAVGGSVQFKKGALGKRQYTWTPKVFAA